ncbi:MAG TPA: hypothetical protein VL863_05590 [bacterium]|jgi:hypothetical protein|nr:hypothetical protein [bacterium]
MKLVTIATNFNLADAGLVCSRLDAAGFHPTLVNENASNWLGGTSTATMLQIQVPEDEAANAKEFLDTPVE